MASTDIIPATKFDIMVRSLPISFLKAMGRGQANNNEFYNRTAKTWKRKENYVPLSDRQSNEWDVRLDLTEQLTATAIVEAAKVHKDQFLWGLVSGIEYGKSRQDRPTYGQWIADAESFHVHIAVVLNKTAKREEVLKLFREHKVAGEYCVPRDQKQTYAGWRMHHRKAATKIDDTAHLWEYGTCPFDTLTEENGRKVLSMRRLYGRESDDLLYELLLDVGRRVANQSESQRKRKQQEELEELRAEVKRLRESIQQ
uniref:Replication-associated protein n=1 Tax=Ciconia boyciana CRESS-DNA-virus sp. TaxID=2815024 RepID=A0A8A4XCW2_9VIRU|nr:MAG: replication-associated protein [Ciconia boyciana CRESS-DNA-virus sp.]